MNSDTLPAPAPKMIDIARSAKVAIGTVSRVLNTPELVEAHLRQHVLDVIERMGYRPLRRRRNHLRRRRRIASHLLDLNIGVIAVYPQEHATAAFRVVRAIERHADGEHFFVAKNARSQPQFIARDQVHGLIVVRPHPSERELQNVASWLQRLTRPIVWAGERLPALPGDVVRCDSSAMDLDALGRRALAQLQWRLQHPKDPPNIVTLVARHDEVTET